MTDRLYGALKPLLFRMDPERSHELALSALRLGLHPRYPAGAHPNLRRSLIGLDFPNPIGLAAGFDKNGVVIDALLGLGFGFVEIGTVTPQPQPGNPKPRLFRLEADRALINRLGFNNEGFAAMRQRLEVREKVTLRDGRGIVGINVGANKDSANRIADYAAGTEAFAPLASYLTVNISSPNTPGLRDLQAKAALDDLIDAVVLERDKAAFVSSRRTPVLVKIAPDLEPESLSDIAELIAEKPVDGAIVSNTTLARGNLKDRAQEGEAGGLSGQPLFHRSTVMLARLRKLVGPDKAIIGVGGIETSDQAYDKLAAGADLVQVYTGFIYRGPAIAAEIARGLSERLAREGIPDIAALSGRDTDRWASQEI